MRFNRIVPTARNNVKCNLRYKDYVPTGLRNIVLGM